MSTHQHHTIEVGYRTMAYALLAAGVGWILWQVSGILIGLYISFLIMVALNPLVTKLERYRIPRTISALVFILLLLLLLLSGFAALVPPVIEQTGNFLSQLPHLLQQLGVTDFNPSALSSQLGSVPKNVFYLVSGIFGNVIAVFTTLVISYYLLQERNRLIERLRKLFGKNGVLVEGLVLQLEAKLGGWVRGQIILSLAVGAATYVGLVLIGIPYAVPLAIIAGTLELIPNIGPTLSMVPSAIVGFTISPLHGIGVIALYFIVQQLENNFLVPQVMRRVVGLNPVVTLIALMMGYRLGGALVAVLAIPLVLTAQIVAPFIYAHLKQSTTTAAS